MAPRRKKAKAPKLIPRGTRVRWHYRSAIGHGTVVGIAKRGSTSRTTKYRIRESDHHPGEAPVLGHYGRALTRTPKASKRRTRKPKRS